MHPKVGISGAPYPAGLSPDPIQAPGRSSPSAVTIRFIPCAHPGGCLSLSRLSGNTFNGCMRQPWGLSTRSLTHDLYGLHGNEDVADYLGARGRPAANCISRPSRASCMQASRGTLADRAPTLRGPRRQTSRRRHPPKRQSVSSSHRQRRLHRFHHIHLRRQLHGVSTEASPSRRAQMPQPRSPVRRRRGGPL